METEKRYIQLLVTVRSRLDLHFVCLFVNGSLYSVELCTEHRAVIKINNIFWFCNRG